MAVATMTEEDPKHTVTTTTTTTTTITTKRPLPVVKEHIEILPLMLPSVYRLTEGLPRRELKLMVSEAMICEEALENELRELQDALDHHTPAATATGGDPPTTPSVQLMLNSELAPPDRYFTVSALLGRLRDDLATPLPMNSTLPAFRAQMGFAAQAPPKKKKKQQEPPPPTAGVMTSSTTRGGIEGADSMSSGPDPKSNGLASSGATATATAPSTTLDKQKSVLSLFHNPEYIKEHAQPTILMALFKKIFTHRSSVVFRRPVNPKEAPGYTERIFFPMDLSLIRKMIVARQIKSFSDLHQRLGLIAHNCVKYNGRESDYGIVTRDFESNADEMVVAAVLATMEPTRHPRPKSVTPQPPAAAAAAAGGGGAIIAPPSSSPSVPVTMGTAPAAAAPAIHAPTAPSKQPPLLSAAAATAAAAAAAASKSIDAAAADSTNTKEVPDTNKAPPRVANDPTNAATVTAIKTTSNSVTTKATDTPNVAARRLAVIDTPVATSQPTSAKTPTIQKEGMGEL